MKKILIALMVLFCTFTSASAQFGMQTEFSYGFALNKQSVGLIQIFALPGYVLNEYVFFGAGIGVSFADSKDVHVSTTWQPVVHGTFNFTSGNPLTPYFHLRGGYGFGKSDHGTLGGLYISPSIGVKYEFYDSVTSYFAIAYDSQTHGGGTGIMANTSQANTCLAVRMGIEF